MKIFSVETFVVTGPGSKDGWINDKPYIFVKILTDEGITGWGEAYALVDQERAIAQNINELGRYLIGKDHRILRKFALTAFFELGEKRSGLCFYAAISALEMALWDIAGKASGLTVHDMLGGACRDRVRLYANFFSPNPQPHQAIVAKAVEMKALGFTAIKMYPLRCPTLDLAEKLVSDVRIAIGTETDMMIDLSGQTDPAFVLEAANRFLPYKPFWIEEPIATHDLSALSRVKQNINCRVVSGERLAGKYAFRDLLERNGADTLNPDIALCGGLLAFLEISAMAEAFSVNVTPHNYNSMTIGMATMLQASVLSSNFLIAEYFPYFQPFSDTIATSSFEIEDGLAMLSDKPGLGIELDEQALRAHAFDGMPLRSNVL